MRNQTTRVIDMHATTPTPQLMWPAGPGLEHPAEVERIPLEDRGLPESTYHALDLRGVLEAGPGRPHELGRGRRRVHVNHSCRLVSH